MAKNISDTSNLVNIISIGYQQDRAGARGDRQGLAALTRSPQRVSLSALPPQQ